MDIVHSLDEARAWFLSHSHGHVRCSHMDLYRVCYSYTEAIKFYTENIKDG